MSHKYILKPNLFCFRVFKALQESRQNERVAIDQGQPSEGVHTNTTSQGPDQPLQTVLLNSSEHSEMVDRGQEDLGIGGNQGDVPMKDMQPASETTLISVDDDNQRENVLLEIPTVPPENTVVPQQTTDVPPKTPLVPQGITPEGMDIGEVQKDEQLNSSKQGMTIITNGGVLETKEESVEGKTESSTKKLDTGEQNNTFLQGLQQTVRRDTGGSDDLATGKCSLHSRNRDPIPSCSYIHTEYIVNVVCLFFVLPDTSPRPTIYRQCRSLKSTFPRYCLIPT